MKGFLEFEKFISGGKLVIEEKNVIDIMMVCLYYNESVLFLEAKKYILNHFNYTLTQKLFEIYSFLDNNQLVDLKDNLLQYINNWNWKYIEDTNNNENFIHLPLEIVDYLLNHTLILENEYYLLKQLFAYYEMNIKTLKDDMESKKIKGIFLEFFKKIDFDKVTAKQIFVIDKFLSFDDITKTNNNNNNIKHIYITFDDEKKLLNTEFKDFLFKKYMDLILNSNNFEFNNYKEENILIKNVENLENIINEILINNNDDLIIIIGLLISIKMKINAKLSPQLYIRILTKYNNEDNNENIKFCLLKCITLFLNENDNIKTLYNCCGKEIFNQLIINSEILNNNQKEMIIKFTKNNNIEFIDNNNNIYDNQINNLINMKNITDFHYDKEEYEFLINNNPKIELKPVCDGTECEFEVENEMIEGLEIDKNSGIISGTIDKEIKEPISIIIISKNKLSEKKCEIKITSVEYKFTLNSIYNSIISSDGKIVKRSVGIDHGMDGHAYLNFEMKNNFSYTFKFKFKQNTSFSIGSTIIGLGAQRVNNFNGTKILYESNSYGWYHDSLQSYICVGGNTVVVNGNIFINNSNDVYEVIYDMKTREMKMGKNGSKPQVLIKKLPSPLYPFVVVGDIGNTINLLSVTRD